MGYGHTTPRTFFKIKDGKIVVKNPADGAESAYNFFEGYLKSISYVEKEVEYNGKKVMIKSYNVAFTESPFDESEHIWSPIPKSTIFQSFLNCILNIENFNATKLRLIPYLKNDQQRLVIYANGEKLDWKFKMEELPAITVIVGKNGKPVSDANGNPLWDYTARLEWIQERVDEITDKLGHGHHYEPEHSEEELTDIGF